MFASHATTIVLIEALALSMAASQPDESQGSLEQLNVLRGAIAGRPLAVQPDGQLWSYPSDGGGAMWSEGELPVRGHTGGLGRIRSPSIDVGQSRHRGRGCGLLRIRNPTFKRRAPLRARRRSSPCVSNMRASPLR